MCVCLWVCLSAVTLEAQGGHQIPWRWRCRRSWVTWHECWEPTPEHVKEQCVPFSAEPPPAQPFRFGRKNHRYARYTFYSSGKNVSSLTSPSAKTEVEAFYLFHIRGGKLAESWSRALWILLKPSLSKYCSQVNRLQGGAQELRDEAGFCTLVSLPNLSDTYSGGVAS